MDTPVLLIASTTLPIVIENILNREGAMSQTSESSAVRPAGGMHGTGMTNQTREKWTLVCPGFVAAATGAGAADLVATMIAGQRYGYALLWAVIIGTIMKIVLVESVGRYSLATGNTMFYGWREMGR